MVYYTIAAVQIKKKPWQELPPRTISLAVPFPASKFSYI